MERDAIDGPVGLGIGVPTSDVYRTCAECGGDCYPNPATGGDRLGMRIGLVCPEHGVNA